MESLPVRRKFCLLRLRENCPFRKLRRQTYDVSAATSSPIGSYWNNIGQPTNKQPISTVYLEPLPPLCRCQSSPDQSEAAADVHMEEDHHAENQQNQQNRAEDCMDLDNGIDPETGEKAQG